MRMRLNPLKRLDRSQSQIIFGSKSKESEKNIISFITIKRDNLISAKEKILTPLLSGRKEKLVLPKVISRNQHTINISKNETIDDILNKYKNGAHPEDSKDINNNAINFLFNNNMPNKNHNNKNKLKKLVTKKHISSIEEIKRRNREIRIRKERQEKELFELRQREAKKLMASFKVELDGNNKIKTKVGKRYTLFKEIMIYLESNNVTLDQLAKNDPFQHQAYMIPNSYDFFNAVKYKNYSYVIQALDSNPQYLFSIDYFGQTAYHWAAKLGDLKMLKILMEYGLYHNQKDYKGRTPLYIAAMNNNKEISSYVLSKGANIFLKDKNGLTPADGAGSPEMKSFLLDFMSQPFSNPIFKARVKQLLLDREDKIKKKEEKLEEEKIKKENENILFNGENKFENKDINKDK